MFDAEEIVDVEFIKEIWNAVKGEMQKAIIGMNHVIEALFIALLSEGHVLLEGPPGVAKTMAAQNFAATLSMSFRRIQMVPDMLPADLIGTMVYDQKEGTFRFKKGPIFANIVLIDEINRAPPKTQAALLEAMEEKAVTIEGVTYKLPRPFLVLATQNPIELEGTYPLPEAQVSRFMLYVKVNYPDADDELKILKLKMKTMERVLAKPVTGQRTVLAMQRFIREKVYVDEEVLKYIRDLVITIRKDPRVLIGCSPRASIALLMAAKSYACMNGRDYVIPDDVKHVAYMALEHRIILKPEVELGGVKPEDIVRSALEKVSPPR